MVRVCVICSVTSPSVTLPPTKASGKANASSIHSQEFQERRLIDDISLSGKWVSKTRPAQMETRDANWGKVLDRFLVSVAAASACVTATANTATKTWSEEVQK